MGEDLPKETIIIVGCVCGGVVVILSIILIVLCCKRNQAKQHYEKQQESSQMHPVPPTASNGNHDNGPTATELKPAIKGLDNPGLDQSDHGNNAAPRIFTTDTSGNQYRPASPYGYDKPPNGYPNGQLPHGHHGNQSMVPQVPPPSYDNMRNEALNRQNIRAASPIQNKMLYLDDPYDHKDPASRSESGMSTPDPQKPKKVIYEVVV